VRAPENRRPHGSKRPDLFVAPSLRAPGAIDIGRFTFSSPDIAAHAVEAMLARATLDAELGGDAHALALHGLVVAQGSRLKALKVKPDFFCVALGKGPPHARTLSFHAPTVGLVALPWRPALGHDPRAFGPREEALP
jgi:hypothetical protein